MNYRLEDLIDIPLFQNLQEKLNVIYSFPSAIIDNDGNILTAVAWQDICAKFHRLNPQCEKECIKSDQYILQHITEANPAVSYQCPHGLIDNATPIIIDGKHLGNFFTGQFFLEKPDPEFFKKQAGKYGFDEKEYLLAVEKVPVWSKEKLSQYLDFIKGFIEIIANIGYKNLKEIEGRNRTIIDCTSDWIWEIDGQGLYCYCSDRIQQILGYTVDEIIGKSPFDLMPQEESEHIKAAFQSIVETKSSIVDLENWNVHKDGHKVCLLTNGIPLFDEAGKITGYRGADKDITNRKRVEEKLKMSEKNLNKAQHLAHIGSWTWTIATDTVTWSEELYHINGRNPDSPAPSYAEMPSCYTHESWELLNTAVNKALEDKESYGLELKIIRPDGTKIHTFAHGEVVCDAKGEITGLQGTVQDINERKLAEEALRESEKEFRLLAEAMPQMVWITRPDGWNIYCNQQWIDYTGLSSEETSGHGWNKPFHPDDQMQAWDAWQNAIQNNGMYSIECRLRRADGEYKWWLIRGVPVFDTDGAILKWFGTCTDIDELKKAEKKLRESEEKFRLLTEKSSTGIYILQDEKIVYVNPSIAESYGFSSEEMINNLSLEDLIHPDDYQTLMRKYQEKLDGKTETGRNSDTYRGRTKNGSIVFFEVYGMVIMYRGRPAIMGTIIDITERKLAKEALQAKMDELLRFQKITVGRELAMIELKKEVNELLKKSGQAEKYRIVG